MHAELARTLGNALRTARLRRQLTQEDVARAVDVNVLAYGRMERGRMLPSVRTLSKLCLVLKVSSDELFGFSPPGPKPGPAPHERN